MVKWGMRKNITYRTHFEPKKSFCLQKTVSIHKDTLIHKHITGGDSGGISNVFFSLFNHFRRKYSQKKNRFICSEGWKYIEIVRNY